MKRKKLTRKSLSELKVAMLNIDPNEQKTFVGGGEGSFGNPFTFDEYKEFNGGSMVYYYNYDNELCCNLPEVTVTGGTNISYNGGTAGGIKEEVMVVVQMVVIPKITMVAPIL